MRGLYALQGDGAGVAHFSKELWDALNIYADKKEFSLLPLWRREDFYQKSSCVLFPTGAVPLWFKGISFPIVHDVFIFDHPDWFPQSRMKRLFTTKVFLRGLRHSRHIFSVSEDTKNEIVRISGIAEKKVTTVYQGAEIPAEIIRTPVREREDFFLVLGTVEPRKNLPFLFELIEAGKMPKKFKMVIAGKRGWGTIVIPEHEQIQYVGEVSHEEKWNLLRRAKALLLPSLAEGFGRTALEAMSVGTPVIASDITALREVIGDGGVLLPMNVQEAWAETLAKISENQSFRRDLAEKGAEQAKKFSWERTTAAILATMHASC